MSSNTGSTTESCFVIMPFGKKKVALPSDQRDGAAGRPAEKEVDFDGLYDDIFVPAITASRIGCTRPVCARYAA